MREVGRGAFSEIGGFVERALNVGGFYSMKAGVNWRQIKAEYIAGGISQRALAKKHGIPFGTLQRRARVEQWNNKRKAAEDKTVEKITQKNAEKIADNATLLQDIKTKLLCKLSAMVDAYPTTGAAEIKEKSESAEIIYRIRDIAAVYAALEDKTARVNVDIEDLSPLVELLKDE